MDTTAIHPEELAWQAICNEERARIFDPWLEARIEAIWRDGLSPYERRVQMYEDQGATRSDAQGIVDAEGVY